MRARWTMLGVAMLALGGCDKPAEKPAKPPIPVILTPAPKPVAAASGEAGIWPDIPASTVVFAGDLPCADCPGIRTELALTHKAGGWAEGPYRLTETYLERGGPRVTTGEWTTLRGDAVDPDATVYQLDPDRPKTSRYFLRVGDDAALKLLDGDQRALPAGLNVTLKRVK